MTLRGLSAIIKSIPEEFQDCPVYLSEDVHIIYNDKYYTLMTPSKKKPDRTIGDLLFETEEISAQEVKSDSESESSNV